MAELHVQRKRNNNWWLWLLLAIIIIGAAIYFYRNYYNKNGTASHSVTQATELKMMFSSANVVAATTRLRLFKAHVLAEI